MGDDMNASKSLAQKVLEANTKKDVSTVHEILQNPEISNQKGLYQIVIHTEIDEEMAREGTPYFWCVLKWGKDGWHNVRCNWGRTRHDCFVEAEAAYEKIVEEERGKA